MDARHHIKKSHFQQPHTGRKLYFSSRIMLLALLFGCALWVADAIISFLFFREETFSAALFLRILLQDVYPRLLMLGCFCVFGVIVSSMASKQRRTQERLETSEHLLTNVFESIKDGISILGPDLTILRVNKIMREWYQEMLPLEGTTCYTSYHGADRPCDPCPTLRCLVSGRVEQETVPGLPCSAVEWVEVYSYPMMDASGTVTGVVEFVRDVTQKKRLEEEILKTKTLESTGILAGGIAHDFNNLLTVILGNTSLIKQTARLNATVLTLLDRVDQAAARMKDLIKKFVTFSTGENPVRVHTTPARLLQETVSLSLIGCPVQPEYELAHDLWPCDVDVEQIGQVMTAITDNAREAMPDGGIIRVMAENIDIAGQYTQHGFTIVKGRYVRICFSDHGTGIAEKDLTRVFDPYFSTKQRSTQKGMGLGLSAAYSIIKKHNGYIYLESREGGGTEVYILLPACLPEQTQPLSVCTPECSHAAALGM